MTKEEILNKLKSHIAEEKGDAASYYEMAKAAKELGETKLAFTLAGICSDEVRHGEKITQCLMNAGMSNPITEKEKDDTEFIKWKLSRL